MLDLLITGGQVQDGTGSPGFYAAVGVDGEAVRILRGDVADVEAARTIDDTGQVVSPGFIDFHAHSGLVMLAEPRHEPKVRQGITTEVIGVDGNSYAPFKDPHDFDRFVELNSGVGRQPATSGALVHCRTVPEYVRPEGDSKCVLPGRQLASSERNFAGLPDQREAARGSNTSRRKSPTTVIDRAVVASARPGSVANHHAVVR